MAPQGTRRPWRRRPVVNLLPYTRQWILMIDWDQARYSFIHLFLILQFRCTGNNWIEGFDERCCIPSVIYCMSIPSRLIFFIAQNIILYEHPIQISLWAHMIRHDGKMRKIYVHNFDLRQVFTTLTVVLICHSQDSLHVPDLNPCALPGGVREIELSCTSHRRNKQKYRPLLFPVEVSYLQPALRSVRPPARPSARPSVRPSAHTPVRTACLPSIRSVRRSARPSRPFVPPAGRLSVRPPAGPSPDRQSVGPLVRPVHPSARPAAGRTARAQVCGAQKRTFVRALVFRVLLQGLCGTAPDSQQEVSSRDRIRRPWTSSWTFKWTCKSLQFNHLTILNWNLDIPK